MGNCVFWGVRSGFWMLQVRKNIYQNLFFVVRRCLLIPCVRKKIREFVVSGQVVDCDYYDIP